MRLLVLVCPLTQYGGAIFFGEAIDKFDVGVVGNHFALEIEAQPFTDHFRREWCP